MAMTNAERQARYRERRKAGESRLRYRRPADRRARPQQWTDAVQTLLQDQYREWRDALPESLAGSATAALLEQVCDLDLSALEAVELPRGFGRDGQTTDDRRLVGGREPPPGAGIWRAAGACGLCPVRTRPGRTAARREVGNG